MLLVSSTGGFMSLYLTLFLALIIVVFVIWIAGLIIRKCDFMEEDEILFSLHKVFHMDDSTTIDK